MREAGRCISDGSPSDAFSARSLTYATLVGQTFDGNATSGLKKPSGISTYQELAGGNCCNRLIIVLSPRCFQISLIVQCSRFILAIPYTLRMYLAFIPSLQLAPYSLHRRITEEYSRARRCTHHDSNLPHPAVQRALQIPRRRPPSL